MCRPFCTALEAAVPLLGSLNQRHHTQELNWKEGQETGKLPGLYVGSGGEVLLPILNLIDSALTGRRISSPNHRKLLFDRILLPVLEESKSQNARWVSMFLSRNFAGQRSMHPPVFPVKPWILASILQSCYNELPASILNLYHQWFLMDIAPTPEVAAINSKIIDNVSLRDSNEGKHWLSVYGQKDDDALTTLPRMLLRPWQPSVQDLVHSQMTALLLPEDVTFTNWNTYLAVLSPPPHSSSHDSKLAWPENCKPVIKRIVTYIDAIRTPEW